MIIYIISFALFLITSVFVLLGYFHSKRVSVNSGVQEKRIPGSRGLVFIEKHYRLFFIGIMILFLFTRLYDLGSIPEGINIDELGMSYNAYSIANYGTDRYHVANPVYPNNFGGGQSALYTYILVLLMKVFPYSLTLIRIPAVIFGFICLIASYFLIKEVVTDYFTGMRCDNSYIHAFSLSGPFLVTIIPYFFMSERWALDCNLFLSMVTVSLCILLRALSSQSKLLFFMAGISFGVSLYSYAISYLVIPIFLRCFIPVANQYKRFIMSKIYKILIIISSLI